jgi:hypothetical protein
MHSRKAINLMPQGHQPDAQECDRSHRASARRHSGGDATHVPGAPVRTVAVGPSRSVEDWHGVAKSPANQTAHLYEPAAKPDRRDRLSAAGFLLGVALCTRMDDTR